jgi:hypothetical protein
MPSIRLAEQVISTEAHRQGSKQQRETTKQAEKSKQGENYSVIVTRIVTQVREADSEVMLSLRLF